MRVVLALLTLGLAGLLLVAQTQAQPTPRGTLASLRGNDIWVMDLASGEARPYLASPGGQITSLALSPDRQRLAYSVPYLKPTFEVLATEIIVFDASGANQRAIVHEDYPGPTVTSPAWQRDPNKLVFASVWSDGAEQLEELDVASGARVRLDTGSAPSVSPDGQWLVYDVSGPIGAAGRAVGTVGVGWSIWSPNRSSGAPTQIVSADWFVDADVPTFSPDGATVAFAAVGAGPAGAARSNLLQSLGSLLVPVAEAHGLPDPFDLWAVAPDGSQLRRVAALQNRQPFLAWSPDGQTLAAWGDAGLQLVDFGRGTFQTLAPQSNSAPIAWLD